MDRHAKALEILHAGTVIPAIPLALDANRTFDAHAQRRLVRYYLDAGVGGVAVAVHTTQFEIRRPEINLFRPVLAIVKEEIDAFETRTGKVIIRVAGVCGETPQAVQEAQTAKELGFDAVLVSPGGLAAYSEQQLLERTRAIAAVRPVIGFYLQPSVGGRRLSFEYWRALADIEGVAAIKSAPFNRYETLDLVRGCAFSKRSDDVALYTGNDDNIVVDLLTPYHFTVNGRHVVKRFVGGLLGHWSVWTHRVVELFEQIKPYQNSETIPAELLTLGAEITDCNGVFFDVANDFAGCIPGVHEILRRQGLLSGTWCLDANETLSDGQSAEIDRVYASYPQLNDDAFIAQHLTEWNA
ncbi:MAG: dihydrodipicolinate synthase family protein [Ruthenibacterium sp.]